MHCSSDFPPTVASTASTPAGAKRRAAASMSSCLPSTARSAPRRRTSATPSRPEAVASTRAPRSFANCRASVPTPPLAPCTMVVSPYLQPEVLDALQRGQARGRDRSGLPEAERFRCRCYFFGRNGNVLRVEAPLCIREAVRMDPLAAPEAAHARSHARGVRRDQHFSGVDLRDGERPQLEHLGSAEALDRRRPHRLGNSAHEAPNLSTATGSVSEPTTA